MTGRIFNVVDFLTPADRAAWDGPSDEKAGAVDFTNAIQRAFAAALAEGGAEVRLPASRNGEPLCGMRHPKDSA